MSYYKQSDKNKLWIIHDNCLMMPEYFVEFQYVQDLYKGDKVHQIGTKLQILNSDVEEFLTPRNYDKYKENETK